MKYLFCVLVGLLSILLGQDIKADDWQKYSYDTYAARNFSGWPKMIQTLQSQAFSPSGSLDDQIKVMTYYYGYIGHLLDVKQKDEASVWSKKANTIFKQLLEKAPKDARVIALHSMFIAYEIAISPIKAPFQAGSMMSLAKDALKRDSSLYLANLANANISFYFPEALGGDKREAIAYYKKLYGYFLKHPELAATDWMYLNVMSTLAVAYEAIGNNKEALVWCNKALQANPDFVYVKTILLPRIEPKAQH